MLVFEAIISAGATQTVILYKDFCSLPPVLPTVLPVPSLLYDDHL